jgi:hypothetical protein
LLWQMSLHAASWGIVTIDRPQEINFLFLEAKCPVFRYGVIRVTQNSATDPSK